MKRFILFISAFFLISVLAAQEIDEIEIEQPKKPVKSKMILFELITDIWQTEQAGISFKSINRGANIYSMRECAVILPGLMTEESPGSQPLVRGVR